MIRSAFYEKEITPPLGCNIPGYFNERLASGVLDRLYAKALVVENGSETVAIVATDALYIPYDIRLVIVERVKEYTGIKPENVLIGANHTHTGIPITPEADDPRRDNTYLDVYARLVADCVILAHQRLECAELSFGMGEVQGISFNRNYFMKNSTPTTNPGRMNPDIIGPVDGIDPELPVLLVKDKDGTPMGAVICFACHQDCVGGTEYSADFSSALSKELKKAYGNDFVTLFFAGTCGNINHFDVSRPSDPDDHYRRMGSTIAKEAKAVIEKAKPICGEDIKAKFELIKIPRTEVDPELVRTAEHYVATVKPIPGVKIAADGTDPDQYNLAMSKMLLAFLEGPEVFDVPVQVIKIGDFIMYAFPSEIFWQFGAMVKEKSPSGKNIVASLCNATFGYVPTRDMFYNTIYEAKPGSNMLDREAGYIMAEKLAEMAHEIF